MQIILLEKHRKLGDVGNIVNVKNGYARNFLIPNKKAIQATKENKEVFKHKEKIIHQEIEQKKAQAEKISSKLEDKWVYILKQAGKDGKLYGSVTSLDIVKAIKDQIKQDVQKNNIQLLTPVKYIGHHSISVNIFADIYVTVNVIVSRTKEEAEIELKNASEGKPITKPQAEEVSKIEEKEAVLQTNTPIEAEEKTLKDKNTKSQKKDPKTTLTNKDTKTTE